MSFCCITAGKFNKFKLFYCAQKTLHFCTCTMKNLRAMLCFAFVVNLSFPSFLLYSMSGTIIPTFSVTPAFTVLDACSAVTWHLLTFPHTQVSPSNVSLPSPVTLILYLHEDFHLCFLSYTSICKINYSLPFLLPFDLVLSPQLFLQYF